MAAFACAGAPLSAQPPGAPPLRPPREALVPPPPIPGVIEAVVPRERGEPSLAGEFYFFVDESARLSFDEVSSPEFAGRFRLSTVDEINLGFTSAVLWLRIDVRREGPEDRGARGEWLLTFDYPVLDRIDVYDATFGDRPMLTLGDRLPFELRLVPHRNFAIPMPRGGPALHRFFVRIETESSMQVRPAIVSGRELFLDSSSDEFVFGLVYGFMLLMAIYNFFLFLALRDRTYLYFAGSATFGLAFLMSMNGHAFQYLWPDSPAMANLANPLFVGLWIVATAAFTHRFLEPRRHSVVSDRIVLGAGTLGVASVFVALTMPYREAMVFSSGSAAITALVLLASGVVAWRSGHRAARFFTLAWIGIGLGTIVLAFSRFGLVPDNALTRNGAMFGAVVEILLLSLAISDKYRLMHVELKGYSRGLETMVAERTAQLERANATLEQLSLTDPLTSVGNRRHFEIVLESEVRRHLRKGLPLALAMVDIDHFKQFNDRFGHPAGDECLRLVAAALAEHARRPGDLVARYGGEEFAMLLAQTDEAGARTIAERVLAAVRGLEIPCGAAGTGRVTISIGLAVRPPGADAEAAGVAESLVSVADAVLYEAKHQGRDRCIVAELEG